MEAVSQCVGGKFWKAELFVVDLMKIQDMEEVERISPNYEAIVSDELPQRFGNDENGASYMIRKN